MGLFDALIMAVIVAGTAYLLYRSLRRKKDRCCGGCSECGSTKSKECQS